MGHKAERCSVLYLPFGDFQLQDFGGVWSDNGIDTDNLLRAENTMIGTGDRRCKTS